MAVPEHVGQDRSRLVNAVKQQCHALETADRVLGRDVAVAPARLVLGAGDTDERERHAVWIREWQHGLAEALFQPLMGYTFFDEALGPVAERPQRHAERGLVGFCHTATAGRSSRPREEGEDAARTAGLVTVVEMIGRWVIEVDRLLDEAQSEIARVEIEILKGIAGDCRHMMDA